MNKAFLFVIMLVSVSFVGCIEDSSEELSSEDNASGDSQAEEGTITPVGVDNATNMAPYVTAGAWLDEEWIIFDPLTDDEARLGIYVNWAAKDFDGSIANAGFDLDLDMNIDVFVGEDFGILISNTSAQNETLEIQNSNWKYDFVNNRDVCGLIFHTTFAFIAVDNEGATGIQLVQYVFQDRVEYDDMMEIKDNFPGLLGITDDMEDLYDDESYLDDEDENGLADVETDYDEDKYNEKLQQKMKQMRAKYCRCLFSNQTIPLIQFGFVKNDSEILAK